MAIVKQGNVTLNAGAKGDKGDAGIGVGVSPSAVLIETEADLYNASNTLKDLLIQTDITLTADRTLPLSARVIGDGGTIIFNGFELIGQQSTYHNYTKKTLFDVGFTGTISGTWEKLPTVINALDFGVVDDGVDHKSDFTVDKTGTGVIDISTSTTALEITDANLDASRVGQKIVVFNAGGNDTHSHSLITTIASVTDGTHLVLSDAAQNIASNWSLFSSGLNDLTPSGNYTGTVDKEIIVEIDSEGTPDTFRWSSDDETTWTSGVAITGSAQALEDGISITFGATTGHDATPDANGNNIDRWKVFGYALNGVRVFYGTDNYNRIYQGLRNVREKESGTYLFPKGHYMTELIKKTELVRNQQDGLMCGNGTDGIILDGGMGTLQAFPFRHEVTDPSYYKKTDLLQFYRTRNSVIQNFRLVGSYFSDIDKNEHNIGIVASTGALDCLIKNCYVQEFSGNTIFCDGDNQFNGYIQGTAGGSTQSGISVGRILNDGTIDAGQTDYSYSTTILSISGGDWTDFSEIAKYRKVSLTADGSGGWGGLTYPEYDLAIYEGTTFVRLIENVGYFEDLPLVESTWTHARVQFKDIVDNAAIDVRLRCDFNSRNLKMENVNVAYSGQNGASNFTSGTIWDGGNIHDNGSDEFLGVTTQSGYGIDCEDFRRTAQNIRLYNLTFWDNNKGDITFIGTENVIVDRCFFLKSRRPNWAGSGGVSAGFCRNLKISNCDFDDKSVSLARYGTFSNSTMQNGSITLSGLGCQVSDIQMVQGKIQVDGTNSVGHNKQGVNTILSNISIRQYKEYDFILSDRNCLGQWSNINISLNDASVLSNLIDGTSLSASLKIGQEVWEDLIAVGGQPYGGGYLDGFYLQGHLLNNNTEDYSPYCSFPNYEWTNNVKVDCGIEVAKNGIGAVDILWDNLECKFLRINADNTYYDNSVPADPIANPAPKFVFRNAKIILNNGDYTFSNINSRFIKIDPFWIDVIFEGGEVVNNVAFVQTLGRSVFMQLYNFGKVTFNKTLIGNAGAETTSDFGVIDLDEYWLRISGRSYPVELVDVSLKEGTTITNSQNSKGYIAFTQANSLMPTHAIFTDEAAAVTGNYPQNFWYMTSGGDLKVKL